MSSTAPTLALDDGAFTARAILIVADPSARNIVDLRTLLPSEIPLAVRGPESIDPGDWPRAVLVLVDADAAPSLISRQLPHRPHVQILTDTLQDLAPFQACIALAADGVLALPEATNHLVELWHGLTAQEPTDSEAASSTHQ